MGKRRRKTHKNKKYRNRKVVNNMTQTKQTTPTTQVSTYASSYSSFGSLSNKTKAKVYTYKGRKNMTEFPDFVKWCMYTQEQLKRILPYELFSAGYTDVVKGDGYIYAKGNIPVLLTAHMDTVHKEPVKDFYEYINEDGNHILSSPQGIGGDDRCGIYMILEIIKEFKPSILFCEDEESGGIGSSKFCKTDLINELSELNYLIELDRANGSDAVFYDCENPDFTDFITTNTGYKEAWGTFSDISYLSPACKVASVNLSCGYYNAHTLGEEVNVEEMLTTIEVVKELLSIESIQFEYIEARYSYGSYYSYGYGGYSKSKTQSKWDDWYGYDDDDDDSYYNTKTTILWVSWYDPVTYKTEEKHYYGATESAAWVRFFKENGDVCWNHVVDYDVDFI